MTTQASTYKVDKMVELLEPKLTRQVVGSLVGCVHCGMCNDACHYVLTHPDDPRMTPSYKADQLRKLFKRNFDWTGRVVPWWVKADRFTDDDLDRLKDIAFGTCTNCRRCTFNCPMGVDTATLNRIMRGLLTRVGVMPEGVRVVSKDTWELGNQMGVLKEDYIDTIEWMGEELVDEVEDDAAEIRIDAEDVNIMYTINPREVKYDPRSISAAAKIFYAAGEDYMMPSWGWDQTNFGLFSGDDLLGGTTYEHLEEAQRKYRARKVVISECGHGYRSTRCEGPNWSGHDQDFVMESSVITMLDYIRAGRIVVDRSKNTVPVTFHDSCNVTRSCGFYEEPRELLDLVCSDFREMIPNRQENYCCTGGGGAMSMSEYTPRRLVSARVKADQLTATGAKIVVTSCHNCVDGLSDLVKHYELGMEVKQLVDLVEQALVLEECPAVKERLAARAREAEEEAAAAAAAVAVAAAAPLAGQRILVVEDEDDARVFIRTVLEDVGAETFEAVDGDEALAVARREKPDLITLDLSMPGKDGVEAFTELRKDPDIAGIPVCIITGHPEFRKVVYDRAVMPPEGYMEKPVQPDDLSQNLRRILDLADKRDG